MFGVTEVFLALSATIFLGFAGYLLFERTRISDTVLLIGLGVVVGPLLGLVDASTFENVAPVVVTLALVMILFEGALTIEVKTLVGSLPRATVLALLGFAATVAAVAAVASRFLGLDPLLAVLLGCVLGSTCSTVIVPLAARLPVSDRTKVLLGVESVVTDVLAVVSVVALASWLSVGTAEPREAAVALASAFSTAIVAGVALGLLWVRALGALARLSYNYMLTLGVILFLYVAVDFFGGSGPMGVLSFGVVLANSEAFRSAIHPDGGALGTELRRFQGELTFLLRAFFFVWFGMLVDFGTFTPAFVGLGLLATGAILAARVVVVPLVTAGMRHASRGLLLALVPRGLTAAVLAAVPATQFGISAAAGFPAHVFLVIVLTNVVATVGLFAWGARTSRADRGLDSLASL